MSECLRVHLERGRANCATSIRYYLSERFRLRFEDAGIEEMMEEADATEDGPPPGDEAGAGEQKPPEHKGIDVSPFPNDDAAIAQIVNSDGAEEQTSSGAVRTLDGEIAGDEFAGDAINYQILLNKIDGLLDKLKLDA